MHHIGLKLEPIEIALLSPARVMVDNSSSKWVHFYNFYFFFSNFLQLFYYHLVNSGLMFYSIAQFMNRV